MFQTCDVTKWDQLQSLIAVSEKEFGDVPDVYVASARVFESVRLPSRSRIRALIVAGVDEFLDGS